VPVLVATDIVSRGIDIDDIELVINYDVPRDVEDYIHRIGRTARANRKGRGVTFISEEDQIRFLKIERFLNKVIDKLPMPKEIGDGPAYAPKQNAKEGHSGKHGRGNFKSKDSSKGLEKKNHGSRRQPSDEHRSNSATEKKGKKPFWKKKKQHVNRENLNGTESKNI